MISDNTTPMYMPVAPAYGGGYGGGFGGDGLWWVILFFAMMGGGWGGGFGGGGYDFPWLLAGQNQINANTNSGFDHAATQSTLGNIQTAITGGFGDMATQLCGGFAGVNAAINGAANSLINACSMDKINEFIEENGYNETKLNRRMLEWNGTENYTSTRDCGRLLEEVLNGKYVSEKASERILTDLRDQQKRSKIPAGVPSGIETGNKTGELDNVDNDAAIIWSPNATYILVIMSSDTTGRIAEIQKLSSMVYKSINEESQ